MIGKTNKTIQFFKIYLSICLILGVLAQIETIKVIFRPVLYVAWIILVLIYLSCFRHKILFSKHSRVLLSCIIVILSWRSILILCGVLDSFPQLGMMLIIDFVAFLCGSWIADQGVDTVDLGKIMINYSVAACVFAVYLFQNYFSSIGAWLNSTFYQYESKNSAAQLLAQAVLFLLILWPVVYKNKFSMTGQLLRYGAIGWLLIMIALLRCRTALLALAVVAVYSIIRRGGKRRILYIGGSLLNLMIVISVEPLRAFVESALLLNKYGQDATLDQFSSGRISNFENIFEVWMEHPWVGVGRILIDCNPLALLADSGIIGAIPYFVMWLSTVKMNLSRKNSHAFEKVTELLTVYYCISALLEGYPPFGPGVCVVPFWLLSGYNEIVCRKRREFNEVTSTSYGCYTNL